MEELKQYMSTTIRCIENEENDRRSERNLYKLRKEASNKFRTSTLFAFTATIIFFVFVSFLQFIYDLFYISVTVRCISKSHYQCRVLIS